MTDFCSAVIHGIELVASRLGGEAASSDKRRDDNKYLVEEITHDYDVSENTARKDLEKWVGMKVLFKVQEGKGFL